MLPPDTLFLLFKLALGIFGATSILTIALYRREAIARWTAGIGAALGSFTLLLLGMRALLYPLEKWTTTSLPIPWLNVFGSGSWTLDPLNGVFFVLLGFVGIAASIYGIGYARLYIHEYSTAWLGVMTCLFLAAMAMVLAASHAITFLFAWELMTLTSFALVVFQHEKPEVKRAAFLYLVMTQIATACLIAGFAMFIHQANSFYFADWTSSILTPGLATFAFFLLLIGFGTKAGVVPFHVWLPEAHPQAPTHISALMSGVMIKIAIYGFLRVVISTFWGNFSAWWGLTVMALGAISAIIGVFYAIERRDMKKALAFSSIENIGIILLAMGAGMYFSAVGNTLASLLGFTAGMLHIVNHALLKSLLFLGSGNVYFRHHTRSMDWLGGVVKTLPLTSVLFLVGIIGMMGLPPMNGFASEWMTFQTLLAGLSETSMAARLLFPLMISALGFAAGLAFLVFARMFAIVFLGRPRMPEQHAPMITRLPMSMTIGTLLPALGAIAVAIGMQGVVRGILRAFPVQWFPTSTIQLAINTTLDRTWFMVKDGAFGATALVALLLIGGCMLLVWMFLRVFGAKTTTTIGPSWDCGVPLNERMQYSGLGFTSPVRHALRLFTRPKETVTTVQGPDNAYFWHVRNYSVRTFALFETKLVEPVTRIFLTAGQNIQRVQSGHLSRYVAYIGMTLVGLLILSRLL